MLSEKGTLKDTPPLKLLLTVFEQGLTGILYVKKDDTLKVLYFSRGKLIWAISNSEDDKLENILLARNIVDQDTLLRVKKEAHVSESIGKLLVERGLITLEELIDSSKEQLKRIIFNILKWKEGGFQFVKDLPPERLISLDLNITDFIVNFIVEVMDVSEIWKSIGSLQIELIKNPDEEKLSKYQLSENQYRLLNSFDGEMRLETILSRYTGGHRESLLKIIYFFIMAELVIKKEFELSDLSAFDHEREIDYLDEPKPHRKKAIEFDMDMVRAFEEKNLDSFPSLSTISRTSPGDYVFDEENDRGLKQEKKTVKPRIREDEFIENVNTDRFKKPVKSQTPSMFNPEESIKEEKKKGKFLAWSLVLVFFIFIIGGIILLVLPWFEKDSVVDTIKTREKKASEIGDIMKIVEQKPDSNPSDTGTVVDKKTGETSTGDAITENRNIEKPIEAQNKPEEMKDEKKGENKGEEKQNTPVLSGKSADIYFKSGNLITAGDVWRKELMKGGIKFSILLEMDCMKESVMHTYNRLENKKEFFILNKKTNNRICFLVFWGKFKDRKDASNNLKYIPAYFWRLKEPPEIVELSSY